MTHAAASCRRAMSLIEMLVVMVILASLATVASRVYVLTVRLSRDARHAQHRDAMHAAAVRAVRSDVWAAKEGVAAGDRLLLSPGGDGPRVMWQWSPVEGQLQRWEEGAAQPSLRRAAAGEVTFEARSGVLHMRQGSRTWPLAGPMLAEVREVAEVMP